MGDVTRAAAAVLCDREGRVLLVRRASAQHRWGLPGARIGPADHPAEAALRELRRETSLEGRVVDLLGLYLLCGQLPGDEEDLPDLLTYAFRCELVTGEPVLNGRGRIDDLGWYDAQCLPAAVTATATAALRDCAADRSGVVRTLTRDLEPA
jgi:8-oxo-dGTP pyrophosphatase MutT (NUDIX family)